MARMWGARVKGTSPRKSGTDTFRSVGGGLAGGPAAVTVGAAGAGLLGSVGWVYSCGYWKERE